MISFCFKYRRIFLAISLLSFLFSCKKDNKEIESIINSPVYHCKIFTSSESSSKKLISSDLWISSSIPQDDIIIFAFDKLVYINKIIIEQTKKKNFDKIKKIKVYSNNGIIGDFIPDCIKIDDTLGFLIFKIEKTKDFQFTKFYKDSFEYKIAFTELNKACAIDNIKFFVNDSVQIKLVITNNYDKNEIRSVYSFPKIVDYSFFPKAFLIKKTGEIFGFSRSSFSDTIYHGFANDAGKLNISKFVFSNNSFKSKRVMSELKFKKKNIEISFLPIMFLDFDDYFFVDVKSLDTTIIEDMRYATSNNFTGKVIYDCGKCLMRYGAAKDFVEAEKEFFALGYRIKVFDCYRPHSAQYKLWEIMPNKNYVANPQKGSIHNRGAAVDMTLVDSLGNELDMGTEFDYFGLKAFSTFFNLPDNVLKNRQLMWSVMRKHGFKEIKTEWWHLSHYSCMKYPISDLPLPCNK